MSWGVGKTKVGVMLTKRYGGEELSKKESSAGRVDIQFSIRTRAAEIL